LPVDVLEAARDEFVDYHGSGMALFEMSHRSAEYEHVHDRALALAHEVFAAPDDFSVLLVQGGATLQFAMVPMNLLEAGRRGAYVRSGTWGVKALEDAAHHGDVYAAWDGEQDQFTRMPGSAEIELGADTRYLHITSNETIHGIRFSRWPEVVVPLVADVSSEYMSRPIPWERFDLVYGGVQKNLGPPGLGVVFIRDSVLESANRDLAAYLRYGTHQAKKSLYNTPPMFSIYLMGKTLEWMADRGGLPAMERAAERRAALVYGAIDQSDGFYRSPVEPASRSLMNVVFRLPSEDLEAAFLTGAAERDMVNLKGHRSVGGIRASLYNAMPLEGAELLARYMAGFRAANT
jgi:phosphoserine aminotransferase